MFGHCSQGKQLNEIVTAEGTFLLPDPYSVADIQYRLSVVRVTQLLRPRELKERKDEKLRHNWRKGVLLYDEYAGYARKF